MSGHSKWSTIKRKKEVTDQARGKLFSKLVKGIQVAVKVGGPNSETNNKLRMAIEQARAANMPKENIERALKQAEDRRSSLEEIVYEGFGPGGVAVMVEAATDNRNRTAQEIKAIFDRSGGSLGGPGSASYAFTNGEPDYPVLLSGPEFEKVNSLKDALDEQEDVQNVYINAKSK